MRSLPPADYLTLPGLSCPAAYICVIRDVDSDRYRLQAAARPRDLIDAVLAERARDFGIELLSILESDDIAASEARLYARHHAQLGSDWLSLDAYQLRALKKSELRVNDHGSQYISQVSRSKLEGDGQRPRPAAEQKPVHGTSANRDSRSPPSLTAGRFDPRATRRRSGAQSAQSAQKESTRKGIRQAIDEALTDIWTNHPWKCLLALTLLALLCFVLLTYFCPGHRISCVQ